MLFNLGVGVFKEIFRPASAPRMISPSILQMCASTTCLNGLARPSGPMATDGSKETRAVHRRSEMAGPPACCPEASERLPRVAWTRPHGRVHQYAMGVGHRNGRSLGELSTAV